jgi:hypothetical protein
MLHGTAPRALCGSGGDTVVDERLVGLDEVVPASGLLGYLNFSQGRPDPRWQKQLGDAYAFVAGRGALAPWAVLHDWLRERLEALQAGGAAAFRDAAQARAVVALVFERLLPAYRRHHADLLAHRSDRDLLQPFFLARACEAVLAQGGPWDETQRLVAGALDRLNDFVGYRPVAILENRPRGEPYDHERVRPIPLYLKGAGVACGRHHDLLARALDVLNATDPGILAEAQFDPQLLDELAVDPRAYDHGHPVNRRPNYVFGEWDPHHLDNQGRYRRFVVRQVILDALLERVEVPGTLDPGELLSEAAAVLAGTILMASGISGSGPSAHDSGASLAKLMPGIARYREAFYARLLARLPAPHAERLRQESATTRQPFGAARQHLNQYLARQRATQLQQRSLAGLFAEMGYPEESRREAARIPAASVRMLSEVLGRLATGRLDLERGDLAAAAQVLPAVEDLLHRGIHCGAFADPWNILGFQGLFSLSPAREDSVRDPRIDELVHLMQHLFGFYARLMSEAAAGGEQGLVATLTKGMRRLAGWWDQFASVAVGEVRPVHGGEAAESAEHVAAALARWHERGASGADLGFWRQHLDNFRSPKAFALVVDALLRKGDYRAGMALMMNWMGQAEQVPLEDGEHSFHTLALRWMLGVTARKDEGGRMKDEPEKGPSGSSFILPPSSFSAWPLVVKFFDYLEANAEGYWRVPSLGPELLHMPREAGDEDEDDLYGAAYEDVTYRDSADDNEEGAVADGGGPRQEFHLEAEGDALGKRLRFLATVARLWMLAARQDARLGPGGERAGQLSAWLSAAREKEEQLLALLDALQACAVPQPIGSEESLVEYDRRVALKGQLLYQAIATCLDMALAVGALLGAAGGTSAPAGPGGKRPEWEPWAVGMEQAFLRGDAAQVRTLLPRFLESFRREPLLFVALEDGGEPRQILRARMAQTVLRAVTAALPRLGLLRETYHVLKAARAMEQEHPVRGRGVTEFSALFEAAFQGVVECVVSSADTWPEEDDDRELVAVLETLTAPFLNLWIEHSRSLRLSALEAVRGDEDWQALRDFVRRYGGDLFHARFMTLGNLRGILHRGVGAYLDYLIENPDPLHPVRLVEDLEKGLLREPAERHLQLVLQAVVENYEEYKDYNTTTTQSDYGENLHLLLEFLRLKASYDRHAWQFRPLVMAHEVLARSGRVAAAVFWEEGFARTTQDLATEHQRGLARLEREHGMRLGTVADRLGERFVKPLALDRLCALVGPAMDEAAREGERPALEELREELRPFTAVPAGVGLDVPAWLRRLEAEVQGVQAAHTRLAELAEDLFQMPERALSQEELRQQLQNWDRPPEEG